MWESFKWRSGAEVQHLRTFAEAKGQRYRALEPKAGVVQRQGQFFTQGFLNHRVLYEGGVLAEECGAILTEFFRARRAKG